MTDKRLTKSFKSHNEPQSLHCLVRYEDAHLSCKRYKAKKPCFSGHLKVHKYRYTQIHTVFVFFKIFPFLLKKKKKTKNKNKNKQTNKQTSILKSLKN